MFNKPLKGDKKYALEFAFLPTLVMDWEKGRIVSIWLDYYFNESTYSIFDGQPRWSFPKAIYRKRHGDELWPTRIGMFSLVQFLFLVIFLFYFGFIF